jgi:hypothetical protein
LRRILGSQCCSGLIRSVEIGKGELQPMLVDKNPVRILVIHSGPQKLSSPKGPHGSAGDRLSVPQLGFFKLLFDFTGAGPGLEPVTP